MTNHSSVDAVFAALADPTRRAVVERLGSGPASVSDLAERFPMSLPSFLQHVKQLEAAGIVTTEKAGRVRTCTLQPLALAPVERWITERRATVSAQLDRLGAYLEAQEKQQ